MMPEVPKSRRCTSCAEGNACCCCFAAGALLSTGAFSAVGSFSAAGAFSAADALLAVGDCASACGGFSEKPLSWPLTNR